MNAATAACACGDDAADGADSVPATPVAAMTHPKIHNPARFFMASAFFLL